MTDCHCPALDRRSVLHFKGSFDDTIGVLNAFCVYRAATFELPSVEYGGHMTLSADACKISCLCLPCRELRTC